MSIVWCRWMLTERSLNQKWYPVLPNLLILFLQMALRGHPRMMLRSRSTRGGFGPDRRRGMATPRSKNSSRSEKRRESTNASSCCDKWGFDDDIPMSNCQICSVQWTHRAKIHPRPSNTESQHLRLSISKLNLA